MKLIVISSSKNIENEAKIVTKLFEAGLENFHLSKKKLSKTKMQDFISKIPKHFHDRIIIHSNLILARKFKLRGINLSSSNKRNSFKTWLLIKFIKFKNPAIQITTSYTNIGELFQIDKKYDFEYVFLSPIFDSSHSKFQKGFSEHGLSAALKKTKLNTIARGGVEINSIEKAHQLGFYGLAFYSSIWNNPDPVDHFNKLIEEFEKLNIPIE